VGYGGIQWMCCKMARYRSIKDTAQRDTKDTVKHKVGGYRSKDQQKYRWDIKKIHARGELPLECRFIGRMPYPVFEAVGYKEKQQIQLDTAIYVRIQLDTVGYSEISWIHCKMARYRWMQGYSGIPRKR